MARYRSVDCNVYIDGSLDGLNFAERSLFIYFMLSPLRNEAGLFQARYSAIKDHTAAGIKVIERAMVRLQEKNKVAYDHETDEVWLRNGFNFVTGDNKNKAAVADWNRCKSVKLKLLFAERFGHLLPLNLESIKKGVEGASKGLTSPLIEIDIALENRNLVEDYSARGGLHECAPTGNPEQVPPPVEHVIAYAETLGISEGDARYFWDKNQQDHWLTKNGRMKDWQAGLRAWQHNRAKYDPTPRTSKSRRTNGTLNAGLPPEIARQIADINGVTGPG